MSLAKSAGNQASVRAEQRSAGWARYTDSLRYGLHVITHPFDGFWDLIHEKRGTLAAAHTFLFLFLLVRILKLILTSFQFINAPIQYLNILEQAASLALPFLVLCIANWAMTTLFEGKGRFRDIYMAMCYALVPYILIQLPMVIISNGLTFEEGSIFSVMLTVSVIWCAFLVFIGLMQVHDYGPGKTMIFIIVTLSAQWSSFSWCLPSSAC
jgi:hypothetical protein